MLNFPPCLSLRLFVCLAHSIYISALGRGVLLFSLSSSSFYMLLFGVPKYNDGPMQHKRRLQRVLYIPRNHASVHCCVLFFFFFYTKFPFRFSKLRGLCVCVWPRSTWRSLSSKYFLCYWPWRDDKFQSPSERTGDPGRWKSTRPRIAAFGRFSFWLWIYFGLALHGRHTAGGVHPRFPFRPSPSFCDGASLDGNDFRCETIGRKVEKETQEEEVVRFIFYKWPQLMEEEEERCQILRGRLSEGENIFFLSAGSRAPSLIRHRNRGRIIKSFFFISFSLSLYFSNIRWEERASGCLIKIETER